MSKISAFRGGVKLFIMERKMFFDAYPQIFANAKHLRANMTPAELILWQHLRNNKMGVRFKAQHPLKHFIADFYSFPIRLVIEIDGSIHDLIQKEDAERTKEIEETGNMVIRFSNDDIFYNLENVLSRIRELVIQRSTK